MTYLANGHGTSFNRHWRPSGREYVMLNVVFMWGVCCVNNWVCDHLRLIPLARTEALRLSARSNAVLLISCSISKPALITIRGIRESRFLHHSAVGMRTEMAIRLLFGPEGAVSYKLSGLFRNKNPTSNIYSLSFQCKATPPKATPPEILHVCCLGLNNSVCVCVGGVCVQKVTLSKVSINGRLKPSRMSLCPKGVSEDVQKKSLNIPAVAEFVSRRTVHVYMSSVNIRVIHPNCVVTYSFAYTLIRSSRRCLMTLVHSECSDAHTCSCDIILCVYEIQ